MPELFEQLSQPFPPEDIEWRVQRSGVKNNKVWAMVLAYVTNRAIMDRLDSVVGPANWRNEFAPGPGGGVVCGLSLRINDEWVTKWDGAENTDIESVKGGLSGAMKRAAVQWGIGRYLYKIENGWANVHANGSHSDAAKGDGSKKVYFKWDPPPLPAWALPEGHPPQKNGAPASAPGGNGSSNGEYVFPQGPHEGESISTVPADYLEKLVKETKKSAKTKPLIEQWQAELLRRQSAEAA